jgi:hypothetical protein
MHPYICRGKGRGQRKGGEMTYDPNLVCTYEYMKKVSIRMKQ